MESNQRFVNVNPDMKTWKQQEEEEEETRSRRPILSFADFHNSDTKGRLRLNCKETIDDLAFQNVELSEGLELILADDEIEARGKVTFFEAENIWVAEVHWEELTHQRRLDKSQ